jgi:isopentenyl-diphosphate delta-isomerase
MEYLDIVDKNDNVIGKGTRKSVHKKHQIHRGVHVFVVNTQGEILIQKRSHKKDYYPGFYDASVGAQVLSGENYKKAALRELKEELGIEAVALKKICKYKSFSDRQREIRTLFVTKHEGPFNIDKGEVEKVEFKSVEEIKELIGSREVDFTEGFKLSFEHYSKHLKSVIGSQ